MTYMVEKCMKQWIIMNKIRNSVAVPRRVESPSKASNKKLSHLFAFMWDVLQVMSFNT